MILAAVLLGVDGAQAQEMPSPAHAFPDRVCRAGFAGWQAEAAGELAVVVTELLEVMDSDAGRMYRRRVRSVTVIRLSDRSVVWGISIPGPAVNPNADSPPKLVLPLIPGDDPSMPLTLDRLDLADGDSAWMVRLGPAVGTDVETPQQPDLHSPQSSSRRP
jgi:hypothetical protein